jgi:hypothetical protein
MHDMCILSNFSWLYFIFGTSAPLITGFRHYVVTSLCHNVRKYAPTIPAKLPKTSTYDISSTNPAFGVSPFRAVAEEEAILETRDSCDDRAALASAKGGGKMPLDEEGIEVPKKGGGASVLPEPPVVVGGLMSADIHWDNLQRDSGGTNNTAFETWLIASWSCTVSLNLCRRGFNSLMVITSVKAVPSYPGFTLSLTLNLIFFPAVTLTEYSVCSSLVGPNRSLSVSHSLVGNPQERRFVEIGFGVDVDIVRGW